MRAAMIVVALVSACGARTELGSGTAIVDASAHDDIALHDVGVDALPAACAGVVTIAPTGAAPDAIAVTGGFIYWHDTNGISRVPTLGGTPSIIVAVHPDNWPNTSAFAIGGGNVFFDSNASPAFAPLAGGAITLLPAAIFSGRYASSPTRVYFWSYWGMTTTELDSVAFDGTDLQLANGTTLSHLATRMVFDGDNAAFATADPGVYDYELPGGPAVLMNGVSARDLVVDPATVYFIQADDTNGAFVVAMDRESLHTTKFPATMGAFAIAATSANLYITDRVGSRIRKLVEKNNDDIVDIATLDPALRPLGITTSESCVYWTSGLAKGPGAVMAAPL